MQYLIDLQLVREFATLTKELRLDNEGIYPVGGLDANVRDEKEKRHAYLAAIYFDTHLEFRPFRSSKLSEGFFRIVSSIIEETDNSFCLKNCGIFLNFIINQYWDNEEKECYITADHWYGMTFDTVFQEFALAIPKTELMLCPVHDECALPVKLVSNLDQDNYPRIVVD
jgi:hypothetical protein